MEAVMGEESFGTLVDKLRDADPEAWEETKATLAMRSVRFLARACSSRLGL